MKPDWRDRLLASMVARHRRPLLKFFVSRLPNASDAPDLVQEVYLRLLRHDRPDLIRCPEAYLFTIASHIASEHTLKSPNRLPHIAIEDVPPHEMPTDGGTYVAPAPEDVVIGQDRVRQLEAVLETLSPKARATLIWHRRDGKTYNEIGAKLGISRNMVKKYLAQALSECRKRIEQDDRGQG